MFIPGFFNQTNIVVKGFHRTGSCDYVERKKVFVVDFLAFFS